MWPVQVVILQELIAKYPGLMDALKEIGIKYIFPVRTVKSLKEIMQAKVRNSDRSNYNPQIIASTLKAVSEYKYKDSQMTLF